MLCLDLQICVDSSVLNLLIVLSIRVLDLNHFAMGWLRIWNVHRGNRSEEERMMIFTRGLGRCNV